MSTKQSKLFEIIFTVIILALYVSIAVGNVNAVLNWFLTDDAFYYFQVARNVSEGAGFTFDGLNLSNGFHPLWMFICIPIFSLAKIDLVLPLRVLILVIGIFQIGSFILLFRLLKRFIADEIAILFSILWGFSSLILYNVFMGGVESAINVFFILLLWERLTKFNLREKITEKELKDIFILGLIGVLTILSRLDNVYLVFYSGVWLWIKWWKPPQKTKNTKLTPWIWRFKTGTAFFGIIVFVMSTYLAWNKIVFGTYMPVSGQVKLWWGNLFDSVYGHRVVNSTELFEELFSPNLNVGPWALLVSKIHKLTEWFLDLLGFSTEGATFSTGVWVMMALIAALIILLILIKKNKFIESVIKMGLVPFFLGTLTQAAYYKRFGSVAQRSWYWVGEFISITVIVAVLVSILYSIFSDWKWFSKAVTIVVIGITTWLPYKSFQKFSRLVANGERGEPHEYFTYVEFLEDNYEPGTVIGMTGSGAWGYFAENYTIVNLDGLINSLEYFEMMKDGTAAELLSANGLEYVIGAKYILTESNPYAKFLNGHLMEIDVRFHAPGLHLYSFKFLP